MPDARIDAVADLVAAAILAGLGVGDTTAVTAAEPLPDVVTDPESPAAVTGRTAYVIPVAFGQRAQLSRADRENGYAVSVLVVSRFTAAGPPTDAWVRAERKWVEQYVYDRLNAEQDADQPVAGYWCESAEVAEVYAPDLLRAHKLFWSQADFEFRRIE